MPTTVDLEISLVICTHNRPRTLSMLLAALRDQVEEAPVEVVVVDSASGPVAADEVRRLVDQVPHARLCRVEEPGVSLARNAGLRNARAPWIAFLDDDELPPCNWLTELRALAGRLPADCALCGGNVLPIYPEGSNPKIGPRWSTYLSTIDRTGEFDQTEDLRFGIGHSLARVDSVKAIGGFDQRLGRRGSSLLSGEEVLLVEQLIDAGWRIWHSDRIEVGHIIEPERLTPAWARQRAYWEGVTTARLLGIHDRRALHTQAAKVAVKAALLGVGAAVAPELRELRLRFAFVSGFLSSYARGVAPKPDGQRFRP